MAAFWNKTVLCLRPQCERSLSSMVLEVQYGSSKGSAITAGFFMFFSSIIYFRKLNLSIFFANVVIIPQLLLYLQKFF